MSSSKHTPVSYASSPAWSLNSLTGTTSSQAPSTPIRSSVALPPTPPSAHSDSLYPTGLCTPGAPRMRSVPLPPVSGIHGLPTPPTSPQRVRGGPTVHPLLVATSRPIIYFDLARPASEMRLANPAAANALNEAACHPPTSHLTIVIPNLIWTVEVPNSQSATVNHVLRALYEKLHRHATKEDYNRHSHPIQQVASQTFLSRSKVPGEGLKRIDFLGHQTKFAGLSKMQDGSDRWVVHFL